MKWTWHLSWRNVRAVDIETKRDNFDDKKALIIDAILEDNKRVEVLAEQVLALADRQKMLEEENSKHKEALQRVGANTQTVVKEIKSDVVEFINDGLQQIEDKVGAVVESTLTTYAEESRKDIQAIREQFQGAGAAAIDQKVRDSEIGLTVLFEKKLQGSLGGVHTSFDEMKREFASALNEAEDTAFKMNEKMIESIVIKMKVFEKDLSTSVQEMRASMMKSNGPSSKSTTSDNEFSHVIAEIEILKKEMESLVSRDNVEQLLQDAKKEIEESLHGVTQAFKNLQGRVEAKLDQKTEFQTVDPKLGHLESKIERVEEKLNILERIKKSGLKDTQKNGVLSYFLSPDELMYSNRSGTGPQDKRCSAFEKKRVPTINLHGLVGTDRSDAPGRVKEAQIPRQNPDDSYTSFEEEFRFRLGNKPKEEGQKIDDIKLSYVFSSHSKDGKDRPLLTLDLPTGGLSRRLFEEEPKFTDHEVDIVRVLEREERMPRITPVQPIGVLPLKRDVDEYRDVLQPIKLEKKKILVVDQWRGKIEKEKSGSKKKVVVSLPEGHNKENQVNNSTHPKVQDEGFDFEKWARENELQISGFNFN